MADDIQFSLKDILFHIGNALNGVDESVRQGILQGLGASIKYNMAIDTHVIRDEFKGHGIELQLDICKRCGSDDVKDKMRRCPGCDNLVHTRCSLTLEKCCRRCTKR